MSKYKVFWEYLKENQKESYELSFENVKNILGFEIDHSFLNAKKELIQYGYTVEKISLKEKKIKIKKIK